jgi:hypothetical protein
MFNSIPAFPSITFWCGSLITHDAPAVRKQAFSARLVWLVQALDLCDLVSHQRPENVIFPG